MKAKLTQLQKAARYVIRKLHEGRLSLENAIRKATRLYRVNSHKLWVQLQLTSIATDC